MLRLWLAGRIAGELDGSPLPMPTSERARALVGWLGLHPGPHPRAEVAAHLWPQSSEAGARGSLRTALWSLRQSWGPTATDEWLLTGRDVVGLVAEGLWVDVSADLTEAEALSLADTVLPGVDDEWVALAGRAHHEHLTRSLRSLAERAESEERPEAALALTRRWIDLEPLDELAHRALLSRLSAVGDSASAAEASREFALMLHEELGIRPSPATRAAHAEALSGASSRGSPRAALFGRSGELRQLQVLWSAAAAGRGQVVVITGEGGIGKSTLLTTFSDRVGAKGGRLAIGSGIDVGGETPFGVWLELARALVSTAARVPSNVQWPRELNRLSGQLGAALGRPEPPPAVAAPELERLRVFESVLWLVEWCSTDRPALIAVDDAHRADRASLRLTAHIARRVASLPVLLVLCQRDRPRRPELEALVADLLGRSVPVTFLDLGPMSERDLEAVAASRAPRSLDDGAMRRVVAAAEGNPLLAVESALALARGDAAPPANLRTAVRAVVGTLEPRPRFLAQLLAAAGRPLDRAELAALQVPDSADAEAAAIEAGVLVRWPAGLGYRHALLREAAYADILDPAPLHDRVAQALTVDASETARHLGLAGRPSAAAREWVRAAQHARAVGALTEAGEFLERAVECAPDDPEAWVELTDVRAWMGLREASDQAWEEALRLLPPSALAAAWTRRGRQFRSVICHPEESAAAYRRASEVVDPSAAATLRADIHLGLAWAEAVSGDPDRMEQHLGAAQRLAATDAAIDLRAEVDEVQLLGLVRQGRFAECAAVARRTSPERARTFRPDRSFAVFVNAACALACAGDHDGALELAERAVAATEAVPVLHAGSLAARAHLLARLGRHDEAAECLRVRMSYAERFDSPRMAATAASDAGLVALAGGRFADAARDLGRALAGDPEASRPTLGIARAEALVLAGDPAGAREQLRAAALEPVARADQPWALVPRMARVQGLVAAAEGKPELARRRFVEASEGWARILASVADSTAEGYMGSLVDLGRPPVVGLVEPRRELERLAQDLDSLPVPATTGGA